MHKEITSIHNPLVKHILQLQEKSRARKKHGEFVVEGKREIKLAFESQYELTSLLFCDTIITENELDDFAIDKNRLIRINNDVYKKIAFREGTEGVVAMFKSKEHTLSMLDISNKNPLILVAEAPEKPGNIGALLRTADAANVDAVIIANPNTDLYNPNIIRSSVGCLFTNQIASGTTEEVITFLKEKNITIFCAALTASEQYHKINFKRSTAIVVGTEATGLSEKWLDNSDQNIIIPMQGAIDSLNVSVSAGILIYEAKRQRNFD